MGSLTRSGYIIKSGEVDLGNFKKELTVRPIVNGDF